MASAFERRAVGTSPARRVAESQRKHSAARRRKERLSVSGTEGFALEEVQLPAGHGESSGRARAERNGLAAYAARGEPASLTRRARGLLGALRANERALFVALFVGAALLVLGFSRLHSRMATAEPERSLGRATPNVALTPELGAMRGASAPAATGPSVTPGDVVDVAMNPGTSEVAAPLSSAASTPPRSDSASAAPAPREQPVVTGSALSVLERPIAPPEE